MTRFFCVSHWFFFCLPLIRPPINKIYRLIYAHIATILIGVFCSRIRDRSCSGLRCTIVRVGDPSICFSAIAFRKKGGARDGSKRKEACGPENLMILGYCSRDGYKTCRPMILNFGYLDYSKRNFTFDFVFVEFPSKVHQKLENFQSFIKIFRYFWNITKILSKF